MKFFTKHSNMLKKFGLIALTVLLVVGGSFWQSNLLQVQAAVQVLLVSRTAIAFGTVFPGEHPVETYTVQLDTSANSATYITTLDPLAGLKNLCPFLDLKSIDSPAEADTLPASSLSRPGDVLDKWQVQLKVPGIKGELSQDHNGGIIIKGGNFGCKITIITRVKPGKIIICKKSVGDTAKFNFSGDLGSFLIDTSGSESGDSYWHKDNDDKNDKCVTEHDDDKDYHKDGNNGYGNNNNNNGSGSKTFVYLDPGTYKVTEATSTAWQLTSLVCADPNHDTTVLQNTATIKLQSGETIICSYTNTKVKKGKIIIKKKAIGGNGIFSFSGGLNNFSIPTNGGNGDKTFDNLGAGAYTVTENSLQGWKLDSLSCQDPSHNTTVYNSTANIKLSAGETVTCVFTNKKNSKHW